ncbi:hypothetical protein F4604DRAFT_1934422 [Suillus subluteus]|nr:hypothetical protein F4604DRAFT_1934422 [Suillus subluteus]
MSSKGLQVLEISHQHKSCKEGCSEITRHVRIATLCTYFIMACRYRPHDDPSDWTSLLTKDPQCPIPSAWVIEISHTFVGDLMDAVLHTGMIVNPAYSLGWDTDVAMFERFKAPIWVD